LPTPIIPGNNVGTPHATKKVGMRNLPPMPGVELPRGNLPSRVVPPPEAGNGTSVARPGGAQCHASVTGRCDTVCRRNHLGA